MWAIINTGGSANLRHQHGNSTISGAYYVRAPKNSGDIVFYDPRPAPVFSYPKASKPNFLNAQVNGINPKEGALVLFPSYLDHSVNENLSVSYGYQETELGTGNSDQELTGYAVGYSMGGMSIKAQRNEADRAVATGAVGQTVKRTEILVGFAF